MADATLETEADTEAESGTDAAGAPWEGAAWGDAPWEGAPAAGGLIAGVFASFGERGFDLGYRRAVSDAIALLLLTAAEHRRESGGDAAARAAVAALVDRLDGHLQRLSPAVLDEVSDGLGI